MALLYINSDPWLMEHESCEKLFREIMEQLTARSREQKSSQAYDRLSATIRLRMKQYSSEVQELWNKLHLAASSSSSSITHEEAERRTRLVEILQSREKQLHQLFNDRDVVGEMNRTKLLQQRGGVAAFADLGTTGWGTDDEQGTSTQNLSIGDIQEQKKQLLKEQDEGLDELSKVISRQKEIALTIGDEVEFQNEIIDDLADHVERTDSRIVQETRQVRIIDRKERTWVFWLIIILLFIGIVIASLV